MSMITQSRPTTQLTRCGWCLSDPLYMDYHDNEWGKPVYDDDTLFAMLCLESMQAGLRWITILKRRDAYYQAFDNFDAHKIALYDDKKISELMQNPAIIRHQKKIQAIVNNAKAYLILKENGSFSDYLWQITTQDGKTVINKPKTANDIPNHTKLSTQLAQMLKKDGFTFIGSKVCYAFMQATGMVDDHIINCAFKTR